MVQANPGPAILYSSRSALAARPAWRAARTQPCGTPWRGLKRADWFDANLGGGVIRQRVARPRRGKSGGYRTIILFRQGERAFFVYGFPKRARDNIDESDEKGFKTLAKVLLAASDQALAKLVKEGKYLEVESDEQE